MTTLLRLYDILEPQHQDGMRLREIQAPEDQWQSSKFVHKHLEVGLSAVQQSEEDGGHDPITRSGRFCSLTRHIAEMVILTAFKWGWIHVCDDAPPVPSAVCEKTPFGTTIRCKAVANVHTSGEHIWAATITLLTNLDKVDDWAYSKFALDRLRLPLFMGRPGAFYHGHQPARNSPTLPKKAINKRVWDSTTQGSTSPKLHSDGGKPSETAYDTWNQSHSKPKAVLKSNAACGTARSGGSMWEDKWVDFHKEERRPPTGTKTVQK